MNKKWELNEANDALINKISEEFNVSKLVANIIANKGLTNSDEIEVFCIQEGQIFMIRS